MDTRSVALIGLYVLVAFFIYVWLAIPPGTAWDKTVHWGDVATWVSAIASFGAVATALLISGKEARRARMGDADSQRIQAFRVGLLLHPVFAHLMAVLRVVPERIDRLEVGDHGAWSDLDEEMCLPAIRGVVEQIALAGEIPESLAVNVLSTLAWCRIFERSVFDAFDRTEMTYEDGETTVREHRFVLDSPDGKRQLGYAITALKAFAESAFSQTDAVVGDSIALPEHLFEKFRAPGEAAARPKSSA
jgi:hypothetical protein